VPIYAPVNAPEFTKPIGATTILTPGALARRTYPNQKMLQVGATYELGFARMHAAYSKQTDHSLYSPIAEELTMVSAVDPLSRPDADTYMLGVTVPVGPHVWIGSYRVRDGKPFRTSATATFEADRRVVGVAYLYSLSKRTRLYAEAADSLGKKSIAEGTLATDTYNRREFRAGVNHSF
jgi:predicted porin